MHVLQNLHLIFGTKKQTKKLMDLIHQLKVCFVVTKMILSAVADTCAVFSTVSYKYTCDSFVRTTKTLKFGVPSAVEMCLSSWWKREGAI
jgi:H2-forming N5,N10-methylenetetrahydromethanopterin dehydrogenase-like enzyme